MSSRENIISKILRIVGNNWKAVLLIPVLVFLWKFQQKTFKPQIVIKRDDSGATLTDLQAKNIADSLEGAMSFLGTDTKTIFNLLKGISVPNFAKVYNAFGLRYYNAFFGVSSPGSPISDSFNLIKWLNFELSSSELEYLRKISPSIFS